MITPVFIAIATSLQGIRRVGGDKSFLSAAFGDFDAQRVSHIST